MTGIQRHIKRLDMGLKPLLAHINTAQTATKSIADLIPSHAFEVKAVADLKQEIFGSALPM